MKSGTELSRQAIDDPIYENPKLIQGLLEAFLVATESDRTWDDMDIGSLMR
jgi:hypothetical protein